jgi:hypothetical protein
VQDDVFGYLLQAVVARNQVVLAGELALQLGFLGLVQLSLFQQALHVSIEVLVDELQLRDAVLVVQRDGGVVFHRLGKVIDADVLAKHLAGALFSGHQGRAGEGQESRVGQGVAHIERQHVILSGGLRRSAR